MIYIYIDIKDIRYKLYMYINMYIYIYVYIYIAIYKTTRGRNEVPRTVIYQGGTGTTTLKTHTHISDAHA